MVVMGPLSIFKILILSLVLQSWSLQSKASEGDAELYDAAALAGTGLASLNQTFSTDLRLWSTSNHCPHSYTAVPADYPNICTAGARENTATKSNATTTSVRDHRNEDLRKMCSSPEAIANAQEMQKNREKENRFLTRDRDLTQRDENRLALAIGGNPNFYLALKRLSGIGFGQEGGVDIMMGLCEAEATRTVRFRFGRDSSTTMSLHLPDSVLSDRLMACNEPVTIVFGTNETCNYSSVTVNQSNVRTLFECRSGTVGFMADPPLCSSFSNPPGGSVEACLRIHEERERTRETAYWTARIPICQERYRALQRSCEQRVAAAQKSQATAEAERSKRIKECEDRIKTERKAELDKAAAQNEAEYQTALKTELQTRCYGPVATGNRQTICQGARAAQHLTECAGITNSYDLTKENNPNDPGHPSRVPIVQAADKIKTAVEIFRQNYNFVFNPANRDAACLEKIGDQGICDSLKADRQRTDARFAEVYTPNRMARAQELGRNLIDKYRSTIERLLPGAGNAAKRAKLIERIGKIAFVRPQGTKSLESVNGGFATCACHPSKIENASDTSFHECQANSITLSPSLMLNLDNPQGLQQLNAIMMHEIGHAIAPDLSDSDAIFGPLATCLAPKVNLSSFPEANKRTVKKEAVADWLAAEVLGTSMQAEGGNSAAARTSLANQMDFLMCSVLGREFTLGTGTPGCMVNSDGRYRYFNELESLTDAGQSYSGYTAGNGARYSCDPSTYTHPRPPDRLAIFARSKGIRTALGCANSSSSSGTQVQSCSL